MGFEMVKMQRSIKPQQLGQNKSALLLILSIAILLSGCAGAPKFPDVPLWETAYASPTEGAPKEWFCGEYKIKDPRNLIFTPVKDHALQQCVGVFGFKEADFPAVIEWAQRLEEFYKKKLEQCQAK